MSATRAGYAADPAAAGPRRHLEPGPGHRSEYQRDRDRIIHSGAFRRLEYKTQVFVNHEGDLFRTRLTHTLEVAQIARTIARTLRLDEDLVEAICLAHDLGHTPFGHAGQDALNECMRDHGGFEHNAQSLRVVDELEHRYAAFRGLNLTFDTREGILKHCSKRRAETLGSIGQRFLDGSQPSLEAQLANLADEIAYNNHDIDDGIRAGLISLEELEEVPLVARQLAEARRLYPQANARQLRHETIRRVINALVTDLTETSLARLATSGVDSLAAVRAQATPLIAFSDATRAEATALKRFLFQRMYRHFQVHRMTRKSKRVIRELFEAFAEDPRLLPPEHQAEGARLEAVEGAGGRLRVVADYIAGMTDRYALTEHQRLFDPHRGSI